MDFKEIQSPQNLVNFLVDSGRRHRYYYHYTNIESAIKVIDSQKWHLTRGDALSINDLQERQKGSAALWGKTYIASFAYGNNENMAMWGLYGLPWEEAVCIAIPKKAMVQWISEAKNTYRVESGEMHFDYYLYENVKPEITLADVCYISGNRGQADSKLHWGERSLEIYDKPELRNISDNAMITGYLKNNAWAYEQEVRIRISCENLFRHEKIALEVPDYLINNMTIMAGPYFSDNINIVIARKIIEKFTVKSTNSSFQKLVNFRSLCSMCKHSAFIRR